LGKEMQDSHRQKIREWAGQREPQLTVAEAHLDPVSRTIKLKC